MATRQENLTTSADYYAARLAELDAMSIAVRARFNYTADNGQTFNWSDYRASLAAALKEIQGAPPGGSSAIQIAGAPFEILG